MKKITAVLLLLTATVLYIFLFLKSPQAQNNQQKLSPSATEKPMPTVVVNRTVLFVPYWSEDTLMPGFSTYVYFGVTPNEKGINTADNGYAGLPAFVAATQGSATLLTVRMDNSDLTAKILQDSSMQENIIQDSIQVARSYGFDGIVLDLEYNGLAFPSVTSSITTLSTRFAKEVKGVGLSYYQTVFGDTFYLGRPYDVAAITKNADGIFVMSYDFHKARGTPGPNFPLVAGDDADYSFSDMTADFSKKVDMRKLTFIFGMFGYDWTVDSENRSTIPAESLTDKQIQSKFLSKCLLSDCVVRRNSKTLEPSVTYVDKKGDRHIVWFEDTTSEVEKEKVLEKNGISTIGFWANGYF